MSVATLVSGTPARIRNVPTWVQEGTLIAGGGGAILTLTFPFAVNAATSAQVTPLGQQPSAIYWVTRAFGAAGVGNITVNSSDVADVGKFVQVCVFSDESA
jgi:hypothetical protein